jgi:hypothetical protein
VVLGDCPIYRFDLRPSLKAARKTAAKKAVRAECDLHMARLTGAPGAMPGAQQMALVNGGAPLGFSDGGTGVDEEGGETEEAPPPNPQPAFRIIDHYLIAAGGTRQNWGAVCTQQVDTTPVSGYEAVRALVGNSPGSGYPDAQRCTGGSRLLNRGSPPFYNQAWCARTTLQGS